MRTLPEIDFPKRDEVIEYIKNMPPESALNEIIYHLYVKEEIILGLEDGQAGKTWSTQEAKERLKKWLE